MARQANLWPTPGLLRSVSGNMVREVVVGVKEEDDDEQQERIAEIEEKEDCKDAIEEAV